MLVVFDLAFDVVKSLPNFFILLGVFASPTRIVHLRSRGLWVLLSALVALHSLIVVHRSFGSLLVVSLAFLLWWSAWICSEELITTQQPKPSRAGLFIGSLILALCLIRGTNTVHPDNLLTLLTPIEGVALAFLYTPFSGLSRFRPPLMILSLFPFHVLLYRLFPERVISLFTASASGLALSLLGKEVSINGRDVLLPMGGVTVYGPCNGVIDICVLIVVGLIFLICFPLRHWFHRAIVLIAAPFVAFVINSCRIALLAVLATYPSPRGEMLFDFFHDEYGSLLFSGISVSLLAVLFLALLHRQFSASESQHG